MLAASCLTFASAAHAQDLGHKLVGTLGLDAGTQAPPGLYVADRVLYYQSESLIDLHGDRVDIDDLSLRALANSVGVAGVVAIPQLSTNVSAALAAPVVWLSAHADRPEVSVEHLGVGDISVKPLQLGWQFWRAGVIAEYSVYIPTGDLEITTSRTVRGQVTHQFSLGGTLSVDAAERWFASALVSYQINERKHGIDITRGDALQIQGGLGVRPTPRWELGVAGCALWQVQDNSGDDLEPMLRAWRDRVFGLGPEVALLIPAIRLTLRLRFEAEFGVEARPRGQILMFGVSFAALPAKPQGNDEHAPEQEPAQPSASGEDPQQRRGDRRSRSSRTPSGATRSTTSTPTTAFSTTTSSSERVIARRSSTGIPLF